jgi:hypothetical protein
MRILGRLLILFTFLSLTAVAVLAWFALANQPLVPGTRDFSADDVARAERLIRTNDPRRLAPGTRNAVVLSAEDLNLLGGYLVNSTIGAHGRIRLTDDAVRLQATHTLPQLSARRHLNVEIDFVDAGQGLQLTAFRIGALSVPTPLVTFAARQLSARLLAGEQLHLTLTSIDAATVSSDGLRLAYTWHPGVIDDAAETLLGAVDPAALRYYHDRLVTLQDLRAGDRRGLTGLLQPLFASAQERSLTGDPAAENAALITVLGAWASRGLERLVPGEIERPGRFTLKLRGRRDFAKHFLISAALSARGDSALSNAVGLVKEIIDTDRGSGFSFTDIAADLAGSRFGELAVDAAKARGLQAVLAAGVADHDLMPAAHDLPEYMDSAEFKRRFDRVGSPAYDAMMAEIRRRVRELPLYR